MEAQIKAFEDEYKKQLALCFGKTWQGVAEKEKFIMSTFLLPTSSTTTSTSTSASIEVTPNVSDSSSGVTLEQVQKLLDEWDVHWVNWLSSKEKEAVGKQSDIANDASLISTVVTSKVHVPQPSATLPVSQT